MIADREAPGIPREERLANYQRSFLWKRPWDLDHWKIYWRIMLSKRDYGQWFEKYLLSEAEKITLSPVTFTSNMHLRNVIERIVTPLGRRIDEKTPYVDARLKDGSRGECG